MNVCFHLRINSGIQISKEVCPEVQQSIRISYVYQRIKLEKDSHIYSTRYNRIHRRQSPRFWNKRLFYSEVQGTEERTPTAYLKNRNKSTNFNTIDKRTLYLKSSLERRMAFVSLALERQALRQRYKKRVAHSQEALLSSFVVPGI